ncbi:FapA family protein [Roseateles oligotrophus]|uniref:FapA family protein n=1 Tax=Roseateles oligotrophus TaxID=1769250 RepID=A0ABT2YFS4_9BURK|nr:FapA family protein [Roseateles oligotrophus]MCV2368901.1 FapA family protein [Roseateles oligotrophus]
MLCAERSQAPRRRQRGISSVLFMLLSGMSLGAMVFGAIYYVRGLQAQSVTVHALTQAQLKAWSGAEAVRQHLYQLGAAEAAKLTANQAVSFTALSGITATVVDVLAADSVNCGGGTRVGFNITGSSGGANALLAATFCAKGNGGTPAGTGKIPAINIKGNLQLGGDLKVQGDAQTKVVVDGTVNGSGSLTGISNLYATGDITLGGAVGFDVLFSEGNINLSGSALYSSVQSMKNVSLSGTVSVASLTANSAVTLSSNAVTSLNAIGNVTTGSAKLGSLKSKGNVVGSNLVISGDAQVVGNYTESSDGSVGSGNYGGSLSTPGWNTKVKMTRVAGLVVNIAPLTASTVTTPAFDAFPYKALANYVFERVGSSTKVTVNNVSGIPNATYFLAGTDATQDYLCTTSSYSAATCLARICKGYSDYNSCFTYSNGKWTVAGTTMAPGVIWFDGDVEAGTGTYYNSWIATGNINTAGTNSTYAVNYAGYANTCNNSAFPTLAPSNFCKASDTSKLQPIAAGNIAYGAGGLVGAVYKGGKINLSASNDVYGSVLAGDDLTTSGSTVVHGYVSAANLASIPSGSSLGASTSIDLRNLPSGFDPGNTAATVSAPLSATLLWSRYR